MSATRVRRPQRSLNRRLLDRFPGGPHGRYRRNAAHRRMADPRPHAAGGARPARRLAVRLSSFLALTADGTNDYQGRPLGTDFSNVYAAGTYVLEGRPAAPFDPAEQHARQQGLFGAATPFYGWHYPPFFLFIAAALALLPYAAGACRLAGRDVAPLSRRDLARFIRSGPPARRPRWEAGSGCCSPSPSRRSSSISAMGITDFSPPRCSAARLVCARPAAGLAGVLFGLLAYKPQFGLLIPLVLAATGRWRTFAAAAATIALLVLATRACVRP